MKLDEKVVVKCLPLKTSLKIILKNYRHWKNLQQKKLIIKV